MNVASARTKIDIRLEFEPGRVLLHGPAYTIPYRNHWELSSVNFVMQSRSWTVYTSEPMVLLLSLFSFGCLPATLIAMTTQNSGKVATVRGRHRHGINNTIAQHLWCDLELAAS